MSQKGKHNSRSYLNDEIRAVLDLKALVLGLNDCRIRIKRIAWETGNRQLYQEAEAMKSALIKTKRIYSRYWHGLEVELNKDD